MINIRWIAGITVSLIALSCARPASGGELSDTDRLTRLIKPAVVYVQVIVKAKPVWQSESGPRQFDEIAVGSEGTGFIYHPDGYVVTNGHVVEEMYEPLPVLIGRLRRATLERDIYPSYEKQMGRRLSVSQRQQIDAMVGSALAIEPERKLFVMLSNRDFLAAEIRRYSPSIEKGGKDISILKIEGKNLPTVPIGDSEEVKLQDAILVVGFPAAAGTRNPLLSRQSMLEPSFTAGRISALKFDLNGTPVLQTDASAGRGSSGGPAFNSQGQVIGVATFGSSDPSTGAAVAGMNFLVPVNTARSFIREVGVAPGAGTFDQLWSGALDLFDQQKFRAAVARADEVLRLMARQPDVVKLQQDAQLKIAAGGWPVFVEAWGWLLYLVSGVVVTIGLITVVARRRTRLAAAVEGMQSQQPAAKMESGGAAPARALQAAAGGTTTGALQPDSSPPTVAEQPKSFGSLVASGGELAGKRFTLDGNGLWIGRDVSKCQIVLQSDSVSKEHAWIVALKEGVFVIDQGSSNGTFVNSTESPRISKVKLSHGDKILIGKKGVAVFVYQSS